MATEPEVLDLQISAKDAGISMSAVLTHAGVAESTWYRWTHGKVDPRLSTLRKLRTTLAEMVAAREAAHASAAARTVAQ